VDGFSGFRKSEQIMKLFSAREDLCYRTLEVFNGPLEKLAYLASLRDQPGAYRHWGMTKTYGEAQALAAMAEAHTQVWLELLRTPIPELLRQMSEMDVNTRRTVIEEVRKYRALSYPEDRSGGGVPHFNSILLALECLSRSMDATPPAS
jgi:hypothetical protein